MVLSELIYQAVKNVKYLEDNGFTYIAFRDKEYDNDQDYANSINNVMATVNEAIHRLSDRNKIAFRIVSVGRPTNNIVNIQAIANKIKKIKNVFYMTDNGYEAVGYREYGVGFLFIERVLNADLCVQYIEDIEPFKIEDIYDDNKDIELKTIGISNTMCSYIIEYAQGKLQETIEPQLANMHVTRAEQYFDDLEEQQVGFTQRAVTKKFRI